MKSLICFYHGEIKKNKNKVYIDMKDLTKYHREYNIDSDCLYNYIKKKTSNIIKKIIDKSQDSKFVFKEINYLEIVRETLVYLIKDCYKKKYIIEKIFEKESPEKIEIKIKENIIKRNTKINLEYLIVELCKKNNIDYDIDRNLISRLKQNWLFNNRKIYNIYYKFFYEFKEFSLTKLKSYIFHKNNHSKNIKYLFMPFSYSEKNILKKLNKNIIESNNKEAMYIDAPYFDRKCDFLSNQWGYRENYVNSFGEFYNFRLFLKSKKNISLFNKIINNKFIKSFFSSFYLEDLSLNKLILDNLIMIRNTHMRKSIKYNIIFEEIIKAHNIDNLIVAKARWPFMKTVLLTAQKYNINTIFIPHGLYYDDPLWSKTFVKNILIDGKYFKKILIKRGENEDNIVDFGNLTLSLNKNRKVLRRKENKKIITFFSSTIYETHNYLIYEKVFKLMRDVIKKYNNAELYIKLHPRENLQEVKSFFQQKELDQVKFFSEEKSNKYLIINSDAIFCVISSVIIEILSCGIKPYLLNFCNTISYYNYDKKDYVVSINIHKFRQFLEKENIFNKSKINISDIDYFNINDISNMKEILKRIIK